MNGLPSMDALLFMMNLTDEVGVQSHRLMAASSSSSARTPPPHPNFPKNGWAAVTSSVILVANVVFRVGWNKPYEITVR